MSEKELPYKHKGDLTTGSIRKHLVRLTAPMVWSIFAVISVQIADVYFISLIGTRELAGISFTFPVTLAITHILFGLNIAMSSVISRLIGANQMETAGRVVLHGLIMAFTFSSFLAIVCYIFLEPLFRLMGAQDDVMQVIRDYMPLWLAGSVLLSLPVNGNSAIRAAGDTARPAIVMTIIAVVNVILAPLLMFGYFGLPALGVKGAALATFLSYALGTVLGLHLLIVRKKMMATDGLHLDKFRDSMKRLLFIAIPAGIANILQPIATAVVTGALATYGNSAVAAFGIASRIEAFSMVVVIALATGMAPIIGQNWGAGIFARVHETINKSIRFNMLWALGAALLLALLAHPLAILFSPDAEVVRITVLYFTLVPFSHIFGNLVFGWSSSFNAMGKPARAFMILVTRLIILTIPAIYIGSHFGGIAGIFLGLVVVNIASGAFFHWQSWQALRACENPQSL